jgi:predicted nucleotidyltransferase
MRTSAPALLPLFRSEMQVKLLGLVLLGHDRSWTADELSTLLRAPASSVHRELTRAVGAGLFERDDSRRPHEFRAATSSPAFEPLTALLDQAVGIPRRLEDALATVEGVKAAAVHGSWVSGTAGPNSDVDVVIVSDGDGRAAQRAARRVGRELGRDIDVSVVTSDGLSQLIEVKNPFIDHVLDGPRIDVIGDIGELAQSRG